MRNNGDVRCGDCEHYTDDGCEEAAEALVLEGWPKACVCPDDSADAARCPEYAPAAGVFRGGRRGALRARGGCARGGHQEFHVLV